MVESHHVRIGQVLGEKYALEKLIGKGGMGHVYRARHIALGAPRAIKIIRRELSQDAQVVERFRAEALMAETLRHPNLVTLYDFASLPDGTPYIVWEYVEGDTVTERLSRGETFSEGEVVDLVTQIADGLAAAHDRGILHRDVSPDNIMIREEDGKLVAKVLDFGVAKMSGQSLVSTPGSGLLFGKIGFSSPEQMGVEESESLDVRTDVFSLGVVAYLMLVGRLPFRNDTVQHYLRDIALTRESEVQADFSKPLDERWRSFFFHALSRNRESRTPSMEALKGELRMAFERGSSEPIGPGDTAGSGDRRWKKRAVPIAIVIAGAGVIYWGSNAGDAPFADLGVAPTSEERGSDASKEVPAPSAEFTRSEPGPLQGPARSSPPESPDEELPSPVVASPEARSRTSSPETKRLATGTLLVRATPEASVAIDGSSHGITPLELELEPGRHEVVLVATDKLRFRGYVDIVAGSVEVVNRRLDAFGAVTVVSDVWVEVSLDGGPLEQTPISFPEVGAGLHELRTYREGFREQVFEVAVEEGRTSTISVVMEREP